MTDLTTQPTTDLQSLLQSCHDVLNGVIEALNDRPDMNEAIRQLMAVEDIGAAFVAMPKGHPELMRLTLQASVAALVNT